MPSTGTLDVFHSPNAPFIRLDSGVETGDVVSVHYDPQLAKLSVFAPTRALALSRMVWALQRTTILGVQTNVSFLAQLLQHPEVIANAVHTQWLTPDRVGQILDAPHASEPELASLALAATAHLTQGQSRQTSQNSGVIVTGRDPYSPWKA
jgi:acetyl/propionyl-CoA carboxylase alpha subunit